ncbi:bifunctional transcriptional activator/DNA repair enzyme AdaA [Paenibacillus chitinolyticus]|uniref:bifunctional transcriptional activator/DNA repair enzyme AdaA n=1 Tax=Paenibacillus chitinolyticus TaxID=79263 RepID=UPI003662BB15
MSERFRKAAKWDSPSADKWQAIISNDSSYDGVFFYGVKTTGIFCRPSCKSKAPKPENTCIFQDAEQALQAQFRPCKRCKPTGRRLPEDDWIEQITRYADNHYKQPLTLRTFSEICHGSPYHLQRTFKRIKGMTPLEYLQHIRIENAKSLLGNSDLSVSDIGSKVGIPNTSYFITLFKKKTGYTPAGYRQSRSLSRTIENLVPSAETYATPRF